MQTSVENIARGVLEATALPRLLETSVVDRILREVEHGVDVQRWILWLNPNASPELQAAGLLHDGERVVNYGTQEEFGGDRGSEEYRQYKAKHAQRSTEFAQDRLLKLGIVPSVAYRIGYLIFFHDHSWDHIQLLKDEELEVLVSADAFAFFTSVAEDMLAREGEAAVKTKIDFMIKKMPPLFRERLKVIDFSDSFFEIETELANTLQRLKTEVLHGQTE